MIAHTHTQTPARVGGQIELGSEVLAGWPPCTDIWTYSLHPDPCMSNQRTAGLRQFHTSSPISLSVTIYLTLQGGTFGWVGCNASTLARFCYGQISLLRPGTHTALRQIKPFLWNPPSNERAVRGSGIALPR